MLETHYESSCQKAFKHVCFRRLLIDDTGVKPSVYKVTEKRDIPQSQKVTELKSFLVMVNYLTENVPQPSTVCQPLFETERLWGPAQQTAFHRFKKKNH